MDHLGVEVETTEAVHAATTRLSEAGLATDEENDTTCCYALQDKVWVHGPGQEPWEVYVVKADADTLAKQQGSTCCTGHGRGRHRLRRNRSPRAAAADPPMTDLRTSEAATGTGDRSRPRAALPALCATQITSWGIVYYAFPVLNPQITADTGWSGTAA